MVLNPPAISPKKLGFSGGKNKEPRLLEIDTGARRQVRKAAQDQTFCR
jgi:hypothetical protein